MSCPCYGLKGHINRGKRAPHFETSPYVPCWGWGWRLVGTACPSPPLQAKQLIFFCAVLRSVWLREHSMCSLGEQGLDLEIHMHNLYIINIDNIYIEWIYIYIYIYIFIFIFIYRLRAVHGFNRYNSTLVGSWYVFFSVGQCMQPKNMLKSFPALNHFSKRAVFAVWP